MAKKTAQKKSKMSAGKVAAIGAGVAALGAGAYYFLGPDGKKHQKKSAAWMGKMKKEAGKKLSKLKTAGKPIYHAAVDTLAESYSKKYKEHAADIKAFARQLKGEWQAVEKQAKSAALRIKKTAKRKVATVKKTSKRKVATTKKRTTKR